MKNFQFLEKLWGGQNIGRFTRGAKKIGVLLPQICVNIIAHLPRNAGEGGGRGKKIVHAFKRHFSKMTNVIRGIFLCYTGITVSKSVH